MAFEDFESTMKTFYHYREWELQAQDVPRVISNELSDHGKEGLAKHLINLLKKTKKSNVHVAALNFRSRNAHLSSSQTTWLQQKLKGQNSLVADVKIVNENCMDIFGKKHGVVRLFLLAFTDAIGVGRIGANDIAAVDNIGAGNNPSPVAAPAVPQKRRLTKAEKLALHERARIVMEGQKQRPIGAGEIPSPVAAVQQKRRLTKAEKLALHERARIAMEGQKQRTISAGLSDAIVEEPVEDASKEPLLSKEKPVSVSVSEEEPVSAAGFEAAAGECVPPNSAVATQEQQQQEEEVAEPHAAVIEQPRLSCKRKACDSQSTTSLPLPPPKRTRFNLQAPEQPPHHPAGYDRFDTPGKKEG